MACAYQIFDRVVVLVAMTLVSVNCYRLIKSKFNCWPKNAYFKQPDPFPSCPGVTAQWKDPPGFKETKQTISYIFQVSSSFYPWAVGEGIFNDSGPHGFKNASLAEDWCEGTQCPQDFWKANESNCCLHYINLHICTQDSNLKKYSCKPWLQVFGSIAAISFPQHGPVEQGTWVSNVLPSFRFKDQSFTLLAVFRLAGMKAALEGHYVAVRRCGDGICRDKENCESCQVDCGKCILSKTQLGFLIGGIIFALCIIVLFVVFYYRQNHHIALKDETWIVQPYEIFADISDSNSESSSQVNAIKGMQSQKPPEHQIPVLNAMATYSRRKAITIHRIYVATVRGRKVFVKRCHNENFELTSQIRQEVLKVRLLSHPNLCRFVGATVQTHNLYIMYEYCPKGSLTDILQNETISLNWTFRFSLLTDVSCGMAYLHRHNMIHGRLKSNNCLVDDRWICKVTDFGLKSYRRETVSEDNEELRLLYQKKLQEDQAYRAPEADVGIQPASDVYSFGVIMVEVATRKKATQKEDERLSRLSLPNFLSSFSLEAFQISNKGSRRGTVFNTQYQELINRCWQDPPRNRPDFEQVKEALVRMHPNKKSPMDTMMIMMQMYSKNLEQLVETRSLQLLIEKQKTEALLYSILPRAVANSLCNGLQVVAESYENSTIFFSDIVGFTSISTRSTPIQIVHFLNKLYTTFDSVIEQHNVYKVETIGDAYMVVSGVPRRTERHAFHVATMALEIIAATEQFVIPHMPTEKLAIKAGIDSGPVCAGVVGIKMPRYCLFGDTVNTASRMETNSKAGSIHISSHTHKELEPTNEFFFELRGQIPVKGKGEMVTWWLLGRLHPEIADTSTMSLAAPKESDVDISFLTRGN